MSEERKARIGFIGAGGFASHALYPELHRCPEIDLVSVCDLDREKAELNARNFGARRVYTDIDEMLDKEELDGVFCVGSGPQQFMLAPKVLMRGLPVYVEKPSANTSAEARELAELAEKHNTWGQVGFMKRFAEIYLMAKDVMSRPEFGEVSLVKTKFSQGPYPQLWGIDSAKRSFLIAQICHICDLTRYIGGEVATISAMYHEISAEQFTYIANVKFASGALGIFDWNTLASEAHFRDIDEELEVVGLGSHLICRDMLTLDWQPRDDWTKVAPGSGRYLHSYRPAWASIYSPRQFGYQGEVAHFAHKCIGLAEGGPDLWDSYHSLVIGEAVYDSSHSGQPVHIQPID